MNSFEWNHALQVIQVSQLGNSCCRRIQIRSNTDFHKRSGQLFCDFCDLEVFMKTTNKIIERFNRSNYLMSRSSHNVLLQAAAKARRLHIAHNDISCKMYTNCALNTLAWKRLHYKLLSLVCPSGLRALMLALAGPRGCFAVNAALVASQVQESG